MGSAYAFLRYSKLIIFIYMNSESCDQIKICLPWHHLICYICPLDIPMDMQVYLKFESEFNWLTPDTSRVATLYRKKS